MQMIYEVCGISSSRNNTFILNYACWVYFYMENVLRGRRDGTAVAG